MNLVKWVQTIKHKKIKRKKENNMNFNTVNQYVEQALRDHPDARGCDFKLILYTYEAMGININKYFKTIMSEAKNKHYYSFESITRARRDVITQYPELDDPIARKERRKKEQTHRKHYSKK